MKKQLVVIGIITLFVGVGLSRCTQQLTTIIVSPVKNNINPDEVTNIE